ncbi:MAG: hypothetical protein RLZZ367_2100 [Bacteroidota bacterium]|jgi:4-hydroxybenzoate polyprenyltransferase
MKSWLQLLRVQEYVKNVLVFFPAFFGGKLMCDGNPERLALLFLLFCVLCSGVYILNDLFDHKWDINHPTKKQKPITSGSITKGTAIVSAILLLLFSLSGSLFLGYFVLIQFGIYLAVNIFYSVYGKHIPFLDLLLILIGFIIRLKVGSVVTAVPVSGWLYLIIILFSVGFGLAKRLEEIRLLNQHGIDSNVVRPTLKYYAEAFAKPVIKVIVIGAGLVYAVYTVMPDTINRLHSRFVFVTCIPVVLGIAEYFRLLNNDSISIMPQAVLLNNKKIMTSVFIWLVMIACFIYW